MSRWARHGLRLCANKDFGSLTITEEHCRQNAAFKVAEYSWLTRWQLDLRFGSSESAQNFVNRICMQAETKANPADPGNEAAQLYKVLNTLSEGASPLSPLSA